MELDFVQEAKNSERTANNFRSNKQVKVPKVFWEFTTGQVLTMQFCAGHKIDELDSLKQGIEPKEDDVLLDYLREDGITDEPTWYCFFTAYFSIMFNHHEIKERFIKVKLNYLYICL